MARTPQQPPEWTPESIRWALKKIRRRLGELEEFDPRHVTGRNDPKIGALQGSIIETLSDVFGSLNQYWAWLDTASSNFLTETPPPRHEVIKGLERGKATQIERLRRAIKSLEERMPHDFPGEPLDQVALSGRGMAASSGRAGLSGIEARALAGDLTVLSVQNDVPTGGVIIADSPGRTLSETTFELLM
jgi:hypothetical protein